MYVWQLCMHALLSVSFRASTLYPNHGSPPFGVQYSIHPTLPYQLILSSLQPSLSLLLPCASHEDEWGQVSYWHCTPTLLFASLNLFSAAACFTFAALTIACASCQKRHYIYVQLSIIYKIVTIIKNVHRGSKANMIACIADEI